MEALKDCTDVSHSHLFSIMLLERIQKLEEEISFLPTSTANRLGEIIADIATVKAEITNADNLLSSHRRKIQELESTINRITVELNSVRKLALSPDFPPCIKRIGWSFVVLLALNLCLEVYKAVVPSPQHKT
jgi:hypothetical protein